MNRERALEIAREVGFSVNEDKANHWYVLSGNDTDLIRLIGRITEYVKSMNPESEARGNH